MATMVSNSAKMVDDMSASNRLHAMDLQAAFKEICEISDTPVESAVTIEVDPISSLSVSSNRDFLNKRKVGQRPEKQRWRKKTKTPEPEPVKEEIHEEPVVSKPKKKWVKNLYRKIVVETHPDKVQAKQWPEIKKEKYVNVGMKALDAYSEDEEGLLIIAGAEINIYSNDIGTRQQLQILNDLYSSHIHKIDAIQGSLAWKWGSFWASKEERIGIIQHLCVGSGFQPPASEKIVEVLKKLDFID